MSVLLRLILPVLLLLSVAAACITYSDDPAEGLGSFGGRPTSLGLALLPVTFLAVHLTNRRYGAGYAFGQVVVAWLVALVALPAVLPAVSPPLDLRTVGGFGIGLFLAQIIAVIVFDGSRGPQWWTAPLFASAIGGVVLSLIAFPAAFAGTPLFRTHEIFSYMGLTTGGAIVLLIPYGLLRSLVPPRPGFGGY